MSVENGIAPSAREADAQAERPAFEIPPEMADRYKVRVVDGPHGDQRIGLFRPGDRDTPTIEITDRRIVARGDDAETIASLVKIAQHNGWDRIDVDGSAEFRKAVWTAASREGLTVSGYEPTFAEQERLAQARTSAEPDRERGSDKPQPAAARVDPSDTATPTRSSAEAGSAVAQSSPGSSFEPGLADDDRRLLLTLSHHTEDRKALYESLRPEMDTFDREVRYERIDANRDALDSALERALESPALVDAFERSGFQPKALRQAGKGGGWDGEIADAIYLVRSGLHRDTLAREPATTGPPPDEIEAAVEAAVEARSVADTTASPPAHPAERKPVQEEQARDAAAERRHESEVLAELFLHGAAERVAAEPRLANALQAQTAMEHHIGEVFDGDRVGVMSANLESRQLISEALRRGLEVSAREAMPVRQIEPVQIRAALER